MNGTTLYNPLTRVSASPSLTESYPIIPRISTQAELAEKEKERIKNDKMRLKIKRIDMLRGRK